MAYSFKDIGYTAIRSCFCIPFYAFNRKWNFSAEFGVSQRKFCGWDRRVIVGRWWTTFSLSIPYHEMWAVTSSSLLIAKQRVHKSSDANPSGRIFFVLLIKSSLPVSMWILQKTSTRRELIVLIILLAGIHYLRCFEVGLSFSILFSTSLSTKDVKCGRYKTFQWFQKSFESVEETSTAQEKMRTSNGYLYKNQRGSSLLFSKKVNYVL